MRRGLVLGMLVLCPFLARASDESDVLRARGARLAAQGKCDEALPLFAQALAADPKEARSALLAGRCQIQAKQYADAEKSLDEAARRDPSLKEVSLEQAIARYHQENYAGARRALEAARPTSSGDARFELYDGLVLLQEGKRSEGIAALERARRADPSLVEPTASYFEGLALENQGNRTDARAALDRVVANDPNGRWGTAARMRLDQWALSHTRSRDYWASVTVGAEGDSNVVLRGNGVDLPQEIKDESDMRTVWAANAGWEFLHTHDWGAGAMITYTGTAEHSLPQFSYDYPIVSGWLDRRITENLSAQLQADYAYGWVDGQSWVSEVAATPSLVYTEARDTYTRLFGRFQFSNYYFPVDGTSEFNPITHPVTHDQLVLFQATQDARNRDGRLEQAGLEQGLPIDVLHTQLTASTTYSRYHAEGAEYSFRGVAAYVTTETDLPWQFTLLLGAGFAYRGYLNPTTFEAVAPPFSDKRRDQVTDTEIALQRPIYWDWLLGSARWHYTHADSTVAVFDYDRSIIGGYLTVRIP
ncbi:MAG TPA: tetratricopeptide repeat protein [Myxococcota bacterium]|nr:tetratricopeptide repeat protein [Myxococcota bacterium]